MEATWDSSCFFGPLAPVLTANGSAACQADRIPADDLKDATLRQDAIISAFAELESEEPQRQKVVARTKAETKRTNESLDRYYNIFENGYMPERACAPESKS